MISSSHRRPRTIALISQRRRSAQSGRMSSRKTPCGIRISRNRFDGGFCQGIDNVADSADRSIGFSAMTSRADFDTPNQACNDIVVEFDWSIAIESP
jgi:hypothetical protein